MEKDWNLGTTGFQSGPLNPSPDLARFSSRPEVGLQGELGDNSTRPRNIVERMADLSVEMTLDEKSSDHPPKVLRFATEPAQRKIKRRGDTPDAVRKEKERTLSLSSSRTEERKKKMKRSLRSCLTKRNRNSVRRKSMFTKRVRFTAIIRRLGSPRAGAIHNTIESGICGSSTSSPPFKRLAVHKTRFRRDTPSVTDPMQAVTQKSMATNSMATVDNGLAPPTIPKPRNIPSLVVDNTQDNCHFKVLPTMFSPPPQGGFGVFSLED